MATIDQVIVDNVARQIDYEYDELGAKFVPQSVINNIRLINLNDAAISKSEETIKQALRLNSFQSLYYFIVQVLRKDRVQTTSDLSRNLHFQMCQVVMKDGLKEVIEIPRDHYKTTIYSEGFPIWRALPFTNQDEDVLGRLLTKSGHPAVDLYLAWMRRTHNPDIKIVTCNEIIDNAIKIGQRIRGHYENNFLFKGVFPEIQPDASCTWKDKSLEHKRTKKGLEQHQGEGTYDYLGVGAALQSRHYDVAILDDLVGKEALKSETVMKDTIEYFKLLIGAFDADVKDSGRDNDEVVVGNRWAYNDLNSYIRAELTYYNFITHSALGGCCPLHPFGEPIFPEAFNLLKLSRWKKRLGTYHFSCQFLNLPINPEKCKFKKSNLRYYEFIRDYSCSLTGNPAHIDVENKRGYRVAIRHHVNSGDVLPDVYPKNLQRFMIIDPNHAMQKGRCRHAITVTAINQSPRRVYLLKAWAKSCGINELISEIFDTAKKFKMNTIHLETVAAQKFLKFHLEYYVQVNRKDDPEIGYIRFEELQTLRTENAKFERIDSIIPITERGELWIDANPAANSEFLDELEAYGNKNGLVDILDTLGYGPQVWKFTDMSDLEITDFVHKQQSRFLRSMRQQSLLVANY